MKLKKPVWLIIPIVVASIGFVLGMVASEKVRREATKPYDTHYYVLDSKQSKTDILDGFQVTPSEFFEEITRIVRENYVEEIKDETPLAHGAIRTLLHSLKDIGTRFYEPDEWKKYLDRLEGVYEGIGIELITIPGGTEKWPSFTLTVLSVADNSPAKEAGLKTGDVISEVNGKWVANESPFKTLEEAAQQYQSGKITMEDYGKEVEKVVKSLENMILVHEAQKELQSGTNGEIEVVVLRGGVKISYKITKHKTINKPIEEKNNVIRIRSFSEGVDEALKELVNNKKEVVLDLRQNAGGSFEVMKNCLKLFIKNGEFARIQRKNASKPVSVSIENGSEAASVTVLIDEGTAREAEVFYNALVNRAHAKLEGKRSFGLGVRIENYSLPDGSGYTLTTGLYFDTEGRPLFTESFVKNLLPEDEAKKSAFKRVEVYHQSYTVSSSLNAFRVFLNPVVKVL